MTRKKERPTDTVQERINAALKRLCEGGVLYAKRLQEHIGELSDLTETRFMTFLHTTGTKICPKCADWLRRMKSWSIDMKFLATA